MGRYNVINHLGQFSWLVTKTGRARCYRRPALFVDSVRGLS